MKLLTLNAHALQEADYERKLVAFAEFVIREQIDLIALQEAGQSRTAPEAEEWLKEGIYPSVGQNIPIRADNYAAWAAFLMRQAGVNVSWAWLPVKLGYGRMDEGLAILSSGRRIDETDSHLISRTDDYFNWKTRKVLGVRLCGMEDWFYSVHTGRWEDLEEPFADQWERMCGRLKKKQNPIWLMGDFNSPSEVRNEGYDMICCHGWIDCFGAAECTCGYETAPSGIDGWRDRAADQKAIRIDYVFSSRRVCVKSAQTVFDGVRGMRVSDHFGVLIETE